MQVQFQLLVHFFHILSLFLRNTAKLCQFGVELLTVRQFFFIRPFGGSDPVQKLNFIKFDTRLAGELDLTVYP